MQDYETAVRLLSDYVERLPAAAWSTVNHFAVVLLLLKLAYVGGPAHHPRVPALLARIRAFPEVRRPRPRRPPAHATAPHTHRHHHPRRAE